MKLILITALTISALSSITYAQTLLEGSSACAFIQDTLANNDKVSVTRSPQQTERPYTLSYSLSSYRAGKELYGEIYRGVDSSECVVEFRDY